MLKYVSGYDGLYLADEHGTIYSIPRRGTRSASITAMIPQKDNNGYMQLCLCKNGKTKTEKIHRLIAKTFLPNPNHCKEVNHIDEDKANNAVSNLEWCTRTYNVNYGSRTLKTQKPVAQYDNDLQFIKAYESIRCAARAFDISPGNISKAMKTGRRAGGFYWKGVINDTLQSYF